MPASLCYVYERTATPDAPYTTNERIEITIKSNIVSGIKSGTQSGPDMTNGYSGTLTGLVDDSEIRVVYSYTIEGSDQKEEEIYTLLADALVKHRYTLLEEEGILVPDVESERVDIQYNKVDCDK